MPDKKNNWYNNFEKYFYWFILVLIIATVGLLGFALASGGINPQAPVDPLNLIFSFAGYMIIGMITGGILLGLWICTKEDIQK